MTQITSDKWLKLDKPCDGWLPHKAVDDKRAELEKAAGASKWWLVASASSGSRRGKRKQGETGSGGLRVRVLPRSAVHRARSFADRRSDESSPTETGYDVQAIDEIERIKRDGFLTYFRSTRQLGSPDEEVIEEVSVTLRTPDDPADRCVARVEVQWVSHFVNASLAPRLKAEAGNIKMLALFPEILSPFFAMDHGALSPDAFVAGLIRLGIQPESGNASYKPLARTCSQCAGLFGTYFRGVRVARQRHVVQPLLGPENHCHRVEVRHRPAQLEAHEFDGQQACRDDCRQNGHVKAQRHALHSPQEPVEQGVREENGRHRNNEVREGEAFVEHEGPFLKGKPVVVARMRARGEP
ncbi:MAG TPA: hypothetical protein VJU59_18605 [Paraburkholderia sp.]|uniref:hypothetical protein n=1 Tax=Paraburkholderia sp. TaxID=1926495 RepID=UPI002B45F56E|nr:hypothetical protein [Paraburkholderia sp.]HKR41654.1 hypothetical protein [Paraburkholderia sp.]